jgi:hypothetical protein
MSLNRLIENTFKPWLNVRVNNLTVDGTFTGPAPVPAPDSVTERGTMPNPATLGTLPFTITATIPNNLLPVANSWYSLQYLIFLTRPDNTKAKISDFNVIAYVDATFNVTQISTNEWPAEYPAPGGLKFASDVNNPTGIPYQVQIVLDNLQPPNAPLEANPTGYNYAFVVSDSRRLA